MSNEWLCSSYVSCMIDIGLSGNVLPILNLARESEDAICASGYMLPIQCHSSTHNRLTVCTKSYWLLLQYTVGLNTMTTLAREKSAEEDIYTVNQHSGLTGAQLADAHRYALAEHAMKPRQAFSAYKKAIFWSVMVSMVSSLHGINDHKLTSQNIVMDMIPSY
jgi:hypothetical protein